jgi:hypothetical protein
MNFLAFFCIFIGFIYKIECQTTLKSKFFISKTEKIQITNNVQTTTPSVRSETDTIDETRVYNNRCF